MQKKFDGIIYIIGIFTTPPSYQTLNSNQVIWLLPYSSRMVNMEEEKLLVNGVGKEMSRQLAVTLLVLELTQVVNLFPRGIAQVMGGRVVNTEMFFQKRIYLLLLPLSTKLLLSFHSSVPYVSVVVVKKKIRSLPAATIAFTQNVWICGLMVGDTNHHAQCVELFSHEQLRGISEQIIKYVGLPNKFSNGWLISNHQSHQWLGVEIHIYKYVNQLIIN